MTANGLAYISQMLEDADIPYNFIEWNDDITYPYFVGEYLESEPLYEDGESESNFILTGTTRGLWLDLEIIKEKIRKIFPDTGHTAILENNTGIAIFYTSSKPVPTGADELKRIEINLKIKEWRIEV